MHIDPETIVRVLLRHRASLSAYISSIVRDPHVAEDVLQEVSGEAVRKHAEIRDEAHLLSWMRRAARLRAIDELRRRRSRPQVLSPDTLDRLDRDWETDSEAPEQMLEALRRCVARLSPYGRQLVSLRYVEGLSGQALAERLGRKLNTVHVALARIYRNLGACIDRQREAGGA